MKLLAHLYQIVRRDWVGYTTAVVVVLLTTTLLNVLLPRIDVLPRSLAMLYLLSVLGTGSLFGNGPSVLAAVLAWPSFNWFFVGPPNTLFINNDRDEAIVDLLLLVTALIIGQLAAELRRRLRQLAQRERDASLLYEVVRLMSQPDARQAVDDALRRLQVAMHLSALRIELDGCGGYVATVGEWPADLQKSPPLEVPIPGVPASERRQGYPVAGIREPVHKAESLAHIVPIHGQNGIVGRILLVREGRAELTPADDRLLAAVAAQLGQSVDRVRLQNEATEGEILRRTDELKTALLNAVSHDLRTPLASILASAGSLLQDDVEWTEQDRREFAEAIRDEASRLNRIVENLLDISRIEAGTLRPRRSWHDLRTLVDDVVERLRALTSQHTVRVEIPEDLLPVLVDEVAVDQVLSNLIENAAKYAPSGTEIVISAQAVNGETRVEVADQGPGIPQDAVHRLFEPFFQLRNWLDKGGGTSDRKRISGSGLGLAVAQGLVHAHGGRIWAENRPTGGASFVFTLGETPPSEAAMERQGK